jgi:AraC-like DNA-binding protein
MGYMHKIAAIMRIAPYLLARDVAPGFLLRRLQLPPSLLLEEQVWVDRYTSLLLSQEIVRATGDPLAGLHVAQLIRFSDYGDWGEGIVKSRTLLDAFRFACREITRIETGTRVQLHQDQKHAHVSFELIGDIETDPRQFIEASLLVLRRIIDLATEAVPTRAFLPHASIHGLDLEPLFGPQVEFQAVRAELVFDRDALRLPLHPPEPPDVTLTASRSHAVHDTARHVMAALQETISFERPTARATAAALSINVRMMQRQLSSWGVTFEDLLDQYRRRAALEYLIAGEHSITGIAFRLGYSDSAHFTRAFRRWTGNSPRDALKSFAAPRAVPGRSRTRQLQRMSPRSEALDGEAVPWAS